MSSLIRQIVPECARLRRGGLSGKVARKRFAGGRQGGGRGRQRAIGTERDSDEMSIPAFTDEGAPRAPFPLGEVPAAGWFCIETTFAHPSPNPEGLAQGLGYVLSPGCDAAAFAAAHGFGQEVASAETLAGLVRCFNRLDSGGRGLLVTRDHASFNEAAETRATGWIKALHAEPHALWAWIVWTPWGHEMVNGGEFVHFSTEYDYRDFVLTEGGAAPTRLAGCTITNEPRHAGQIPCTNALHAGRYATRCDEAALPGLQRPDSVAVPSLRACRCATRCDEAALPGLPRASFLSSCPASGLHQTQMNMNTNTMNDSGGRCLNSGDAPRPEMTQAAANSEEPKEATAAHAETRDGSAPQLSSAANGDVPQDDKAAAAANSDVPNAALDLEGCCQQAAELLGLADDATPEDLLAAIKGLLDSNQELNDALEEAHVAADASRSCNSRLRFRYLTSRNSSRVALQGQVPNREVNVRVGQGVRAVNTQSKSKADFCTNAVAARERSLGRRLSPAEYSCTWREAMRDYDAGIR